MPLLITIIDDDEDLQLYLKDLLQQEEYVVKTASSAASALALLSKNEPHLVILDLALPDMDGQALCGEIRKKHPQLPIIMLTGKSEVTDKILGLNIGADDYITKHINPEELVARIKARLRPLSQERKTLLQVADLTLDPKRFEAKRGEKIINLTAQEFKLLQYLMLNKGLVLTREMILNKVWLASSEVETRVVDVYMGYLRKKIDLGFSSKLLHSKRGFGYSLEE